jgi:hypothetical protein
MAALRGGGQVKMLRCGTADFRKFGNISADF